MRTIGDQELALLRDVAASGSATVAEVVERFGQPRGLARSTVLTMMERLRKKGHLSRKQVDGLYRYATRTAPGRCEGAASREAEGLVSLRHPAASKHPAATIEARSIGGHRNERGGGARRNWWARAAPCGLTTGVVSGMVTTVVVTEAPCEP